MASVLVETGEMLDAIREKIGFTEMVCIPADVARLTYSRRLKPGDSWMLTHHAVQGTVLLVLSKSATPRR